MILGTGETCWLNSAAPHRNSTKSVAGAGRTLQPAGHNDEITAAFKTDDRYQRVS